jgi:hypothetical protein
MARVQQTIGAPGAGRPCRALHWSVDQPSAGAAIALKSSRMLDARGVAPRHQKRPDSPAQRAIVAASADVQLSAAMSDSLYLIELTIVTATARRQHRRRCCICMLHHGRAPAQ